MSEPPYMSNEQLASCMDSLSDCFAKINPTDALAILGLVTMRTFSRRPAEQRMETLWGWTDTLDRGVRAGLG